MPASESIKVTVEIVDEYSKELEKLDSKLDAIEADDLEIDLDIDDNGSIESTKSALEALEKKLTSTLSVAVRARDAMAKREMLERDMHATLHVKTDRDRELIDDDSLAGPPIELPISYGDDDTPSIDFLDIEESLTKTVSIDVDDEQLDSLRKRLDDEFPPVRVGSEAVPEDDDSQVRRIEYRKGDDTTESITATDRELSRVFSDELDVAVDLDSGEAQRQLDDLQDRSLGGQIGLDSEDLTVHCKCDCGDSLNKVVNALDSDSDSSSRSRPSNEDIGADGTYNYLKRLLEKDARTFRRDNDRDISIRKPDFSVTEFEVPNPEIDDSTIEVSDWANTKTFLETGGHGRIQQNEVDVEGGFRDALNNIVSAEGFEGLEASIDRERKPKLGISDRAIKTLVDENIVRTINDKETGEFIMPGSDKATSLPDGFSGRDRDISLGDGNDKKGGILGFAGGMLSSVVDDLGNFSKGAGNLSSSFSKIGKTLKKFQPTLQMWWNLIALMVPMLFTAAAGALGLVAALGALAGVGLAIGGLGLLGYGTGLEDSMENAQKRVKKLASNVAGVLEPVSAAFNPIVEGIFSSIPREVQSLVNPLKNLTQFGGFFQNAVGGSFDFIRRLIQEVNNLSGALTQIGNRFGSIFGNLIIKLFRWLIKELHKNQKAFLNIARIIGFVVVTLYNLFKAVSFVLTVFTPLFKILAMLSGALSNKFVVGLLTAITVTGALIGLIWGLTAAMNALSFSMLAVAGGAIKSMIVGLIALMSELVAAIGLTGTLASLLTYTLALTVIGIGAIAGAAAVMDSMSPPDGGSMGGTGGGFDGGAPSGGSMGGAGGGSTTIINVDGDVNNRAYQRLQDDHKHLYDNESGIEDRMTPSTESG